MYNIFGNIFLRHLYVLNYVMRTACKFFLHSHHFPDNIWKPVTQILSQRGCCLVSTCVLHSFGRIFIATVYYQSSLDTFFPVNSTLYYGCATILTCYRRSFLLKSYGKVNTSSRQLKCCNWFQLVKSLLQFDEFFFEWLYENFVFTYCCHLTNYLGRARQTM